MNRQAREEKKGVYSQLLPSFTSVVIGNGGKPGEITPCLGDPAGSG
jgi:hypothetical protein